jgi:hypothetical protein
LLSKILNYLEGKSVAIVGNASSIFDKSNGKAIDSHDVVIRFNKGFVTKPESQGTRTDILIVACKLTLDQKASFKAKYCINRSNRTKVGEYTLPNSMRFRLKEIIGAQPSSGMLAIELCKGAKSIDLYGFDGITPTYYNPEGYVTQHNYTKEQEIIKSLDIAIH